MNINFDTLDAINKSVESIRLALADNSLSITDGFDIETMQELVSEESDPAICDILQGLIDIAFQLERGES